MLKTKFPIKDLNVRSDTIKLLEENISRTISDINHSKIFFNLPPGVMKIKKNRNRDLKFKQLNLLSVLQDKAL